MVIRKLPPTPLRSRCRLLLVLHVSCCLWISESAEGVLKSSDILLNSKATRVLAPTIIALFCSQVSSSTQVGHKKLPPLGARPALELWQENQRSNGSMNTNRKKSPVSLRIGYSWMPCMTRHSNIVEAATRKGGASWHNNKHIIMTWRTSIASNL